MKIMEIVGDDVNSVFHEDQKLFKSDTIFVTFKSVTFEKFLISIYWHHPQHFP